MSRIGYKPIKIPIDIKIELVDQRIIVSGPRGRLERGIHPSMKIELKDGEIRIGKISDDRMASSIHGLTRSLINNMVLGVIEGFTKVLEINGTGYRAQLQNKRLVLQLGYSHPIIFEPPDGINLEVPDTSHIRVLGIDKELVGRVAAKIRAFRPPDPYKAKGIHYEGEYIRRKVGKAGA